jgi:hypothetical protein
MRSHTSLAAPNGLVFAGQTARRFPKCQLAGDNSGHSTTALRLQLLGRIGVIGTVANDLAVLAWGGEP